MRRVAAVLVLFDLIFPYPYSMSLKPQLDPQEILTHLNTLFTSPVTGLTELQGGQVARTYTFQAGDQEYVLRINPPGIDITFQKEAFIFQNFSSPSVPVAPILKLGKLGGLGYAVSQKMPGRGLDGLPEEHYRQVLPSLIETLFAIHQIDVSRWTGCGWFDDTGRGMFPTWREHLLHIREEERPDSFYGTLRAMFETTFLEREFFDRTFNRMRDLIDFCPEQRWLVHGGYGYNNVLAHNGQVTAVLDWIDARYGDFLYDVAWLDFWPSPFDFTALCHQYYTEHGVPLPNYAERIACYKYSIGLDGLRFFAKTANRGAYDWLKSTLSDMGS